MRTFLSNRDCKVFGGRFVYLEMFAGEVMSEGKESKERLEKVEVNNPIEFYESNKERLAQGVSMGGKMADSFDALANGDAETSRNLSSRFYDGFLKIKGSIPGVSSSPDLWKELVSQGATTVKILEKERKWVFRFEDVQGGDVLDKMGQLRTGVPM